MSTYKDVAQRKAHQLLSDLGITAEPVDTKRVASSLGLRILYSELGADVSGMLVRDQGKSFICVNRQTSPNRRRFTIAHEIGHFVLGHQGKDRNVISDRGFLFRDSRSSKGTDRKEIAANQFAAALLMPEPNVRRAVHQMVGEDPIYDDDIELLAKRFKVSSLAMQHRLDTLQLF